MTANDEVTNAPVSFVRFVALALGVQGLLWLVGYLPTRRLGGEEAIPAMLLGGTCALAASLLGALPLFLGRGRPPAEKVGTVLGSIALRLLVVVALALAAVLGGLAAKVPLLVWVAVSHGGLLVVDTLYARAEMRRPQRVWLLEKR